MLNITSILSLYFNRLLDFVRTSFDSIASFVLGSRNKIQESVELLEQPKDLDDQDFDGESQDSQLNKISDLFDKLLAQDALYALEDKKLAQEEKDELNNEQDIQVTNEEEGADLTTVLNIVDESRQHLKAIKLASDAKALEQQILGSNTPGVDLGSQPQDIESDVTGEGSKE